MDLRKYERLKSQVDRLQSEADRAEGALAQTMEQLKDKFDIDSLEAAEQMEQEAAATAKRVEAEFNCGLEKFESEWGERLEGRKKR